MANGKNKRQLVVENQLIAEWYVLTGVLVLYEMSSDARFEKYLMDFVNTETPFSYINSEQFGDVVWSTPNIQVEHFGTRMLKRDGIVIATVYEHTDGIVYFHYYDGLVDNLLEDHKMIVRFLKDVGIIDKGQHVTTWGLMKLLIAHPQFIAVNK